MWALALLICTTFLTPLCARNLLDTKQLIATDTNTIIVSTADELLAIATNDDTNNGYANKTIKVINDITFDGSWTSIGTYSKSFAGTFDGGGHTIILGDWKHALFNGVVGGAIIKNVVLKSNDNTAKRVAAPLAESAYGKNDEYVTIENCVNYVSVGGGVSYASGFINDGSFIKIKNCANFGNIYGFSDAAGIIQCAYDNVIVENCYNFGNVTVTGSTTSFGYGIGGNIVINSYSVCDINLTEEDNYLYVISNGTNTNCYYNGTITIGKDNVKDTNYIKVTSGQDLYTKALAAGWDFTNTWIYEEQGININGYPQLRALVKPINIDISVTVTNDNNHEYIIYMLDENGESSRQFVVKNGTQLNIELDVGSTFSIQVYSTLYLRSEIDGNSTYYQKYINTMEDKQITIKLMGAGDVNNWLII